MQIDSIANSANNGVVRSGEGLALPIPGAEAAPNEWANRSGSL